VTPAYQRQTEINSRLGGRVFAIYGCERNDRRDEIEAYIGAAGFEPTDLLMDDQQLSSLLADVQRLGLWDERCVDREQGEVLLASPWGFRWLRLPSDFDKVLPQQLVAFSIGRPGSQVGDKKPKN